MTYKTQWKVRRTTDQKDSWTGHDMPWNLPWHVTILQDTSVASPKNHKPPHRIWTCCGPCDRLCTVHWHRENSRHSTSAPHGGFLKWGCTPKSSIFMGFSIINYKPSILGYPHLWNLPYREDLLFRLKIDLSSDSLWTFQRPGNGLLSSSHWLNCSRNMFACSKRGLSDYLSTWSNKEVNM